MTSFRLYFLSLIFIFSAYAGQAQHSSKVDGALSGFMKTQFMQKFQDIKTEAEGLAKAFQSEQNKYSIRDRTRVSTAYDKTARRFNAVLIDIKNDFLDKEKLKVIAKFPEMYGDGLRADMRDLSDYYAQNFQQALADVTGDEIDGSPIVILLIELVKLSTEGINGLVQMRKNAKRYDEEYLTKHLVRPSQFKYWNELSGNNDYNNNDSYNDDYSDNNYEEDTYNQDTYNEDTYNEDTYNEDYNNNNNGEDYNNDYNNNNENNNNDWGQSEDNYNEENYNNNSTNNLNQSNNNNNNNNQQYDDIENFKFEKRNKNTKKITPPSKSNNNKVKPRAKVIRSPRSGNNENGMY